MAIAETQRDTASDSPGGALGVIKIETAHFLIEQVLS